MDLSVYPHAESFAREVGIPAGNLIRAFEIEREYRGRILREEDPAARRMLYSEVCSKVHPLYRVTRSRKDEIAAKLPVVKLFRRELTGRSILDLGCGTGAFLLCAAGWVKPKRLLGIDIDPDKIGPEDKIINYRRMNLTDFSLEESFDVVFSDNVMEHIAPADLPGHLKSIWNALNDGGRLIVIMPNRLFGPSDVTRVIDRSCTNRIPAAGMHLFESTYSEMIPLLARAGFAEFETVIQIPGLTCHLPRIRISPRVYLEIENNDGLLNLMYRFRFRGKCRFKFMVILLCRKSTPGRDIN